jgi:hypothetical protein
MGRGILAWSIDRMMMAGRREKSSPESRAQSIDKRRKVQHGVDLVARYMPHAAPRGSGAPLPTHICNKIPIAVGAAQRRRFGA